MKLPGAPPSYASLTTLSGWVKSLSASVAAGWNKEHKPDGTHKAVTADSVSVTGDITAAGRYYERGRPKAVGEWTAVPFSSFDFTGSGTLSWAVESGDMLTFAYMALGHTLWMSIYINTSSVSGTGAELRVAIPPGYTIARTMRGPVGATDAAVDAEGAFWQASAGASYVAFFRDAAASNWNSAASNSTSVFGTFCVEVQ